MDKSAISAALLALAARCPCGVTDGRCSPPIPNGEAWGIALHRKRYRHGRWQCSFALGSIIPGWGPDSRERPLRSPVSFHRDAISCPLHRSAAGRSVCEVPIPHWRCAPPPPHHHHHPHMHTHTHTHKHTHTHTPPPVKAPIHTQHTGQHGNHGPVELIPWSWPGGSHGATTPLPGWSWGSDPGSGLKCISHWSRGNTGTHPWPAPWASPMGSGPTRGRQCGHTGSTGRPGKTGETAAETHIHTHTHTHARTHTLRHIPVHTTSLWIRVGMWAWVMV